MSFEGYVQILCENGHLNSRDAIDWMYSELSDYKCEECGGKLVWENTVDETNGVDPETGYGYGYVELEVDKPAVVCTCDKCGNKHEVEAETYKIPEVKGAL